MLIEPQRLSSAGKKSRAHPGGIETLAFFYVSVYLMEAMSTVSTQTKSKYYSCREAAPLLGLDADTVRTYCHGDPPRLNAEKVGRDWLIPKTEIDRYNRERREPGRPSAQ